MTSSGELRFEWDDEKTARNLVKHGIDFVDATQIFAGPTYEVIDERGSYGEERVRAIGEHEGQLYVVVFTRRHTRISLISS